jgi:NTE family protein
VAGLRQIAAVGLAVVCSACAAAPDVTSVTQRLPSVTAPPAVELGVDGDAVALAFSGGGARAAAFSHGVLLGLNEMEAAEGGKLSSRIALITAVSGGAITAEYHGLYGVPGLETFRAAALDVDWDGRLNTSLFAPGNWTRLYGGGLNGPDKLGDWLNANVFSGARMSDMRAKPRVVINATDLYTGMPFAFAAPYFQAICADLGAVRVADAVGASMAVPLAFRPIVAASFAEGCSETAPDWTAAANGDPMVKATSRAFAAWRDPARMKFLHLVDGGLSDNFGLSSLITIRRASQTPYGPFSERDAVRVRRMVFVVVNAEMAPAGDWTLTPEGPGGVDVVMAALDAAINAPKRVALEAFGQMLESWERDLVAWRCALPPERARDLGAGDGWVCDDVSFTLSMVSFDDLPEDEAAKLGATPTRVSLPAQQIDALIAAGRKAVRDNAAVKALTE